MLTRAPSYSAPLFVTAALLLIVLAYLPGIEAPFYLDDYNNILFNVAVHFDTPLDWGRLQYLPSMAGGRRLLSYLTFGINWALTGSSPSGMRWINILLHAINAFLAYLLFRRILERTPFQLSADRRQAVAGLAALLWSLHPIQVGSITYVVQRMNLLAASFAILGTLAFLHYLDAPRGIRSSLSLLGALACLLAGFMCKEWIVLTPLGWGLLTSPWASGKPLLKTPLNGEPRYGLLLFLSLCLVIGLVSWSLSGKWSSTLDFGQRPFGPVEKLMTEARALVFYLSLLILPLRDRFSLIHDWSASNGLLNPPTTVASMIFLTVGLLTAFRLRRRHPIAFLATGWYFTFHLLESGILPLELVFEHRNYFPSLFIFLALSSGAESLYSRLHRPRDRRLLLLFVSLILVFTAAQTALINWRMAEKGKYFSFMHGKYPRSARLIVWQIENLVRQKDYGEAERLAGKALDDEGDLVESAMGRGAVEILLSRSRIKRARGDIPGSIRDARLAADRLTYYPAAQVELALLLIASGKASEAERELRPVVTRDPGFPDAWYYLAMALYRQGRIGEAREAALYAARNPSTDPRMVAILLKQILPPKNSTQWGDR